MERFILTIARGFRYTHRGIHKAELSTTGINTGVRMRRKRTTPMGNLVMTVGAVISLASGAAAATIRLDDGTTVSGDVLHTDDVNVVIQVPRKTVQTIDGKVLPPPLVVGASAPVFSATDIQGKAQSLTAPSKQVTVLHFWVSWCPYCQKDAPKVQATYDQLRDNPSVRILTVSLDQERAKLDQFVQERKVTYPVIFNTEAAAVQGGTDLKTLYEVNGFPVTYVIDQQGVIRRKLNGSFVMASVDLSAYVTELLPKASPPAPANVTTSRRPFWKRH